MVYVCIECPPAPPAPSRAGVAIRVGPALTKKNTKMELTNGSTTPPHHIKTHSYLYHTPNTTPLHPPPPPQPHKKNSMPPALVVAQRAVGIAPSCASKVQLRYSLHQPLSCCSIPTACSSPQHNVLQLAKKGDKGKGKAPNKADLPSKICITCNRPFTWRKKWARVWDDVEYCSDRCRGSRRSPSPGQSESGAAS